MFELSQQLEALAESIPSPAETAPVRSREVSVEAEEGDNRHNIDDGETSTIADIEYERLTSPEDAFEDAFGELDEAVLQLAPGRIVNTAALLWKRLLI